MSSIAQSPCERRTAAMPAGSKRLTESSSIFLSCSVRSVSNCIRMCLEITCPLKNVLAYTGARHRHQEFLNFLDRIDESVDAQLTIHLILDNHGRHKHPEVKKWLAARPRYHVHFTPTSSSWLNQIEQWFAEITRKRIRRGTFRSVRDLIKAIHDYIRIYNKNPQPFQWVDTASRIIRKVNIYIKLFQMRETKLGAGRLLPIRGLTFHWANADRRASFQKRRYFVHNRHTRHSLVRTRVAAQGLGAL
jgi:transposase